MTLPMSTKRCVSLPVLKVLGAITEVIQKPKVLPEKALKSCIVPLCKI